MWRRYQWLLSDSPAEAKLMDGAQVKRAEDEYNRVRPRFLNAKGRVRDRWSKKSIGEMAKVIGRTKEYELPYSLGSSIHHSNAEGLLAHVDHKDGEIVLDAQPSMVWVSQALLVAHANLLMALDTLNDAVQLNFATRLQVAVEGLTAAWKNNSSTKN